MTNIEKEKCKLCGGHFKVIAEKLHDNRYGMKRKYLVGYCFSCDMGETFPKPLYEDVPLSNCKIENVINYILLKIIIKIE